MSTKTLTSRCRPSFSVLKSLKDTVLEHANSQGYFLTEMFRNMMTELPANVAAPFKLGATAEFLSSFVSFVVDTLSLVCS